MWILRVSAAFTGTTLCPNVLRLGQLKHSIVWSTAPQNRKTKSPFCYRHFVNEWQIQDRVLLKIRFCFSERFLRSLIMIRIDLTLRVKAKSQVNFPKLIHIWSRLMRIYESYKTNRMISMIWQDNPSDAFSASSHPNFVCTSCSQL